MKEMRADTAPVRLGPLDRLGSSRRLRAILADYVALTKPRLNFLVVATSAAGYYLGSDTPPAPWSMAEAVCGTTLVAAERAGRQGIGCDISPRAVEIARTRLSAARKRVPA